MLKDEPKLLYIYEYIQIDKDRLPRFDDKILNIGDLLLTEDSSKNKDYYKFVCTIRRAFVGDMQEKLDEVMMYSNTLRYAENKKNVSIDIQYKFKTIREKRPSFMKRIKKYIIQKFIKIDDNYIDDLLYNENSELDPFEKL